MKPGDHPEFFRFPAPPGQSRESTIRLDREGRFWHDGELIENGKLADAMHSWISRHPDDGRFVLTNGYDWTYFVVDDAPLTVRAVRVEAEGGQGRLVLSSGDEAALDPSTVCCDDDGGLYVEVTRKGYRFEARFSRHAQSQLEPLLVEGDEGVGLRDGERVVIPSPRRKPS